MKNLQLYIICSLAILILMTLSMLGRPSHTGQAVCEAGENLQYMINEQGISYMGCTNFDKVQVKEGPSGKTYKLRFGFKMTGPARFKG